MNEETLFFLARFAELMDVYKDDHGSDVGKIGTALYDAAVNHQNAWQEFNELRTPGASFYDAEMHNPRRTIQMGIEQETEQAKIAAYFARMDRRR